MYLRLHTFSTLAIVQGDSFASSELDTRTQIFASFPRLQGFVLHMAVLAHVKNAH